eukprot:351729-Chlamydomonas_euryale.AAC.3
MRLDASACPVGRRGPRKPRPLCSATQMGVSAAAGRLAGAGCAAAPAAALDCLHAGTHATEPATTHACGHLSRVDITPFPTPVHTRDDHRGEGAVAAENPQPLWQLPERANEGYALPVRARRSEHLRVIHYCSTYRPLLNRNADVSFPLALVKMNARRTKTAFGAQTVW